MASIVDVLTEVADVQVLLSGSHVSESVKDGLVAATCQKIRTLSDFNTQKAVQLLGALAVSSMVEAYKQRLTEAVDARLAASIAGAKATSVKQQTLTNILSYLTAKDWLAIESDQAMPTVMIRTISGRLSLLGVRSFNEQTIKWSIAVVLHVVKTRTNSWPTYSQIYQWVLQMKKDYDALRTPYAHDVTVTYPADPRMLPEAVFNAAYKLEDPPITRMIDQFLLYDRHIPLRSNSALLVREAAAAPAHPLFPGMPANMDLRAQLMALCASHQRDQSELPGLTLFGNTRSPHGHRQPAGQPLALQLRPSLAMGRGDESAPCPLRDADMPDHAHGESSEASAPVTFSTGAPRVALRLEPSAAPESEFPAKAEPRSAKVEPGHEPDAEAYEEAAFKALVAKKRPAALMKRPAAAEVKAKTSVKDEAKRRVDVGKRVKYNLPTITKSSLRTWPKKNLVSAVYHKAKCAARSAGLPEDKAKAFARKQYALAAARCDAVA